ncbi:hypothetical protein MPSEU_000350900 [Mayamaea pseudoterrestris]|nr:hypothetical protein MPSEU_000350900 [Mayamaea pseudoterrestris]
MMRLVYNSFSSASKSRLLTANRLALNKPLAARLTHGSSFRYHQAAAVSVLNDQANEHSEFHVLAVAAVLAASAASAYSFTTTTTTNCEQAPSNDKETKNRRKTRSNLSPAYVANDERDDSDEEDAYYASLPVYTSEQVSENNGQDGTPMWMTYGGTVYDVTNFIPNHPGGSEKISQAAGGAIEPYWHLYRQHFASELPLKLMERMAIGRLREQDQAEIDESLEQLSQDDPYGKEPSRHRSLIVHSDTPMNAEVPTNLLTQSYLTPTALFYIRHHHPVPFLNANQVKDYKLKVNCSAYAPGGKVLELSLDELKQLPSKTVTATLQCSGNRRSGFNIFQRTSGTPWGQGAVSTATFTGVLLRDVLKLAGVDDCIAAEEDLHLEHVRFHSLDGMSASIGIEKACNPYGDVLVCYEMNGEPLPREHGFPVRILVPGYAAVRNVKWVEKIELAKQEAEGPWQRGLNYKTLPPNVTDAKGIDLKEMPSMMEVSVFSGITKMERLTDEQPKPGDRVKVKVQGWAWAGGGRNIVRVDVTGDDGKTWNTAQLLQGRDQKFGRAWAWTFWECEVPEAIVNENGTIRIASKAVDLAFNVQPESSDGTWNVRGLGNNSWYRAEMKA